MPPVEPPPPARRSAHTLVELLVVLTLTVALAGLAVGAVQGARAIADRQRTRTELAVIARAIEAFRTHHGAYPRAGHPEELYAALAGFKGPDNRDLPARGRRFLEPAGLSLAAVDSDDPANRLLDPWGRPYAYARPAAGGVPPFWLYSHGPDGESGPLVNGAPDPASPAAADNVYADR